MRAKPGYKAAFINGIQPQGNFCQLNSHRVQVDAINIAVGNKHLDLLQFIKSLFIADNLAGFFLFARDISFCQLIDCFVQERRTAHSRLADGQLENFIRSFSLKKLLQGILNQALGQDLRRVIGCGFLTFSTCQTINESAFFIHAEFARFFTRFITNTLIFGILVKLRFRYKVTDIQLVETVTGSLYFIEVMFSNKSSIGKKRLVHCAHLVDTQIGIGNTTTATISSARCPCQAHKVNDAQHTAVSQLGVGNHLGIFRIEDMCLQRSNQEHIVQAIGTCCFFQFFFRFRIAVINQLIELCQSFMQVIAITDFIDIITDVIRNISQAFQRISRVITLCFNRCIAKFRSGLNKEHKQHTIHIAQTL